MKLSKKQTKALDLLEDNQTTEILYGGGAGGGKSWLGCYWILKNCLKYPGTRWLIGRSKLKTLKQTTLVTFWKVCKVQGIKKNIHFKYNQQTSEIHFNNGSVIILKDLFYYPSDPDFEELGSLEITGAFIDEIAQVVEQAKNIVKTRIRHMLDEFGLVPKLLGTCNPTKNWVKQQFYDKWKEGTLEKFKAFIQSLAHDNPDLSKHYAENILSTGDVPTIERLLNGNWDYDDDPSILMDYDSITDLWTNKHIPSGSKYITADIARHGSDLFWLWVWNGFRLVDFAVLEKSGVDDCVKKIEELRLLHGIGKSQVVCDEDGIGGGVVDVGKYKGFVNSAPATIQPRNSRDGNKKPTQNYASFSDQCAFEMANRVAGRGVFIDVKLGKEYESRIIREFGAIRKDMKRIEADQKLAIIKKPEIKKLNNGQSPDLWDALKMREYFELKPKKKVRATSL